MRFKERLTDVIYEAKLVGAHVIVRLPPPNPKNYMERLTIPEFIERFDESYV